MDSVPIRHAATAIVLRDPKTRPSVLMGQRGANAAFLPNKFVFPGGAVDDGDALIETAAHVPEPCATRLECAADQGPSALALAGAAIRELWEETGQILGRPGTWANPPTGWTTFAERGFLPDPSRFSFVFRAITPPGRPRRFDARFFVIDAEALATDPDDFSEACDELSHLQWVPLVDARSFDLPFITEIVLAEVARALPDIGPPPQVPFFRNDDEDSALLALHETGVR